MQGPRDPRRSQRPAPERGGAVGIGCGLLLGLIVGAYWVVDGNLPSWVLLAAALVCAALAYVYGERFWNWLAEHAWWF
jgi:hypothetical protein